MITQFVGAVAGYLGVSIAVYLQMVSSRDIHPKYVLGFLLVGASLLLINFEAFTMNVELADTLEFMFYVCVIVGEIITAHRVWVNADIVSPVEIIEEHIP